jgi:hypothetical protein
MTQWEMFLAIFRYRRDAMRAWLLNHTGHCSSCPKRVRGPHKFSCYRRPGKGLQLSMVLNEHAHDDGTVEGCPGCFSEPA